MDVRVTELCDSGVVVAKMSWHMVQSCPTMCQPNSCALHDSSEVLCAFSLSSPTSGHLSHQKV